MPKFPSFTLKFAFVSVGLLLWGNPGFAQSPAPYGFWTSASGETLFVSNGGCSQGLNGSITVAGTCSWNGNYGGFDNYLLRISTKWKRLF